MGRDARLPRGHAAQQENPQTDQRRWFRGMSPTTRSRYNQMVPMVWDAALGRVVETTGNYVIVRKRDKPTKAERRAKLTARGRQRRAERRQRAFTDMVIRAFARTMKHSLRYNTAPVDFGR